MSKKESDSKDKLDNHSNQLNSNNEAYWKSRGYEKPPENKEAKKPESSDKKNSK